MNWADMSLHFTGDMETSWLGLGAPWAWVQSLVGELISCKLSGAAKKKKFYIGFNLKISSKMIKWIIVINTF